MTLKETEMWNVYREIELPLIFTLDSMEKWGIRVKGEELKAYGRGNSKFVSSVTCKSCIYVTG